MKNLACAVIGALVVLGCGGDDDAASDDDGPMFPDANQGDDDDADGGVDGGPILECNPISQTGCDAGEKCAFVLDDVDSRVGHTGCVANGTVEQGGDCTGPEAVGESDDCVAGAHCYLSKCNAMCVDNTQCGDAGACQSFESLDYDVCLPSCNPLDQTSCPQDPLQGCYLGSGGAVCAAVTDAMSAPGGPCTYLNDCNPGGGCYDDGMGGGICLEYCDFDAGYDEKTMQPCCGGDPSCAGMHGCSDLTHICGGIQDEDVIGVCFPAADAKCDCANDPPCPPAM
jgi:hypothetical protein